MKSDKDIQKFRSKKFKNGIIKIEKFHLFAEIDKIISFLRFSLFSLIISKQGLDTTVY